MSETGHDPFDVDDQVEQREERLLSDEQKRRAELEDVRFIMLSVQGRRFVWRMLAQAGVKKIAYRHDTHEEGFVLGMQNFGFFIESEVNEAGPELYLKMLNEHKRG
jgi:hypothetical protein